MTLRLRPSKGDVLLIDAPSTLIGRDKTAAIRLSDSSVSRRHATIEKRGQEWVITDGGSANGTFVDGAQVAEAVLKDGQTLRLGAASFRVEIDPPPSPTQTIRPDDTDDPRTRPAQPAYVAAPSHTEPMPRLMSPAEAAQLLGVPPGATVAEVRRQYQKLHRDLEVRITNTPSPSLKRMYQKNLQELRTACEVLAPGALD